MANNDSPFGFRPLQSLGSGDYTGKTTKYVHASGDSVALFIGDPVKFAGGVDTDGKTPTVEAASTASDVYAGVVVRVQFSADALTTTYCVASTRREVFVMTDPDAEYLVQEDSDAGYIAAADVGYNVQAIAGTGDTNTGLSGYEIDSSTAATTNTHGWRILRMWEDPDNTVGNYCKWVVKCNRSAFANQIAGV